MPSVSPCIKCTISVYRIPRSDRFHTSPWCWQWTTSATYSWTSSACWTTRWTGCGTLWHLRMSMLMRQTTCCSLVTSHSYTRCQRVTEWTRHLLVRHFVKKNITFYAMTNTSPSRYEIGQKNDKVYSGPKCKPFSGTIKKIKNTV